MPATEPDITPSLVGRLVTAQFPQWASLPIEPVAFDGWDNRTFHLGEDMIVRLPSAARYAAQVPKEHYWLPKLAPFLPLAMGVSAFGYPWRWSIYRWLEGETATIERIADLRPLAIALAEFLIALQRIDPTGAPPPGPHNFYRGGPLAVYDAETRQAIAALAGGLDTDTASAVWETGLKTAWRGSPVWLHGDVSAGNLLVTEGRLSAVIDFGSSGVGDPACDLAIAWALFSGESRETFRAALPLDRDTWSRGRGWALWKALITLAPRKDGDSLEAEKARQVVEAVLAEHRHA